MWIDYFVLHRDIIPVMGRIGTAAIPLPRPVGAPFRARPVDVNHRGSRPEGRAYGDSTKIRPS